MAYCGKCGTRIDTNVCNRCGEFQKMDPKLREEKSELWTSDEEHYSSRSKQTAGDLVDTILEAQYPKTYSDKVIFPSRFRETDTDTYEPSDAESRWKKSAAILIVLCLVLGILALVLYVSMDNVSLTEEMDAQKMVGSWLSENSDISFDNEGGGTQSELPGASSLPGESYFSWSITEEGYIDIEGQSWESRYHYSFSLSRDTLYLTFDGNTMVYHRQ